MGFPSIQAPGWIEARRVGTPAAVQHLVQSCSFSSLLDFWWNNDTVQMIGSSIESEWCADMKSEIRCWPLQDLARRDGHPYAIDLHLVVVIDLSPRGRAAIGKIAARGVRIGSLESLVKALVPIVVAMANMPFLRRCGASPEQRAHRAELHNVYSETHGGPLLKRPDLRGTHEEQSQPMRTLS
jgi:hypothetical protein